ncbi:MAG: hypothetical protein ACREFO_20095 [Acetobacteraceae bacterium]
MIAATGDETERRSYAPALDAARWLGLAATPTFAIMALLASQLGGDAEMMCSAVRGASPLSGMIPMYLLMSAFHATPWLKLVSRRCNAARRSSLPGSRIVKLASPATQYRHPDDGHLKLRC